MAGQLSPVLLAPFLKRPATILRKSLVMVAGKSDGCAKVSKPDVHSKRTAERNPKFARTRIQNILARITERRPDICFVSSPESLEIRTSRIRIRIRYIRLGPGKPDTDTDRIVWHRIASYRIR